MKEHEDSLTWKCPRCAADPQPANFGSPRRCAFTAEGVFTPENWNCGTLAALMDIEDRVSEIEGTDETVQVINGEDYGGFIVLSRYKHRGCTSSALLVGDFSPARSLTLTIAEHWLDGSFWGRSESPALVDAVDPSVGIRER